MPYGVRVPSLKSRIAARTSAARFVRHSLGLKAPKGLGVLTDPKRAAYNRICQRTTMPLVGRSRKAGGCGLVLLVLLVLGLVKTCGGGYSATSVAPATVLPESRSGGALQIETASSLCAVDQIAQRVQIECSVDHGVFELPPHRVVAFVPLDRHAHRKRLSFRRDFPDLQVLTFVDLPFAEVLAGCKANVEIVEFQFFRHPPSLHANGRHCRPRRTDD